MSAPERAQHLELLRAILTECLGLEGAAATEGTRLQGELGLDSVGLLTLAAEVENRLALILADDPQRPPETLGDVIDLIEAGLREARKPC